MKLQKFGSLFPVSTLTLGGGGLGMLWGETSGHRTARRKPLPPL